VKTLAAAVVGVTVVAATAAAQTLIRGEGTRSTDYGTVDLGALRDDDARFEELGVIQDNALAFFLDFIARC
jgi:hypothetical protein